ncbi:hypothetical protein KXR83_05800 [Williamsia muralis]|uniref:hypothetical protein n=1 Tax=Williamsia marianensis TaxID=85044 RepID=UPI003F17DFF4
MAERVELIDRFGDQIEYDLHKHLGVDLLDFFRGVLPWEKLDRLLPQLPWQSQFKKAMENDPEQARKYAEQFTDLEQFDSQEASTAGPSIFDWDEWRELSADISDKISEQIVAALLPHIPKGKSRPKVKPVRRPKTARQKAVAARKRALEQIEQSEIEAAFLGR